VNLSGGDSGSSWHAHLLATEPLTNAEGVKILGSGCWIVGARRGQVSDMSRRAMLVAQQAMRLFAIAS
jgi:hypothetical protein